MRRIRPLLTPALLAATTVALLTGCAAGQGAQSIKPYAPADGVVANSGDIRVLNALVVAGEGSTDGVVSLTIVNRGDRDDQLTGLTSKDGTVDLTGSGALAPGSAVRFGAGTDPAATISGLTSAPGREITLQLSFARTEPITLRTVVVPATGAYAELTPGPATPAEDTPSPTDSITETPTDSTSSTP